MSDLIIRPYQREALEATAKALIDQGQNRLLWRMSTGTGKTFCFAQLLKQPRIAGWLAQFPKRGASMLVVAHRDELLDQAAQTIRRENPGLMVDIEQGERRSSRYADVIIASIQTLAARKYARLTMLLERHTFRIVVYDEAQHSAAATYRTVLARLGFLPKADESDSSEIEAATHDDVALMTQALEGWDAIAPKDRLLLGVTATPNRTDAIGLGCVFQVICYNFELKTAIDQGYLVPIVPWVIETSESLDEVRITHGEFNQKDLAESVNTERRNALAVESWKLHAPGRSTIAFTVDVQHAHDLAATFQRGGISAAAVSGETPKVERREVLSAYTKGSVQVIANCMIFTEGTDLPRTSCILGAKPTKSPTLFEQMVGRGLRTYPGKADCIVIDMVDIARKHSLQTAAQLYGLPPGLITKGEELEMLRRKIDDLRDKYKTLDLGALVGRFTLQELLDRATTFDVWAIPSLGAFGVGRQFNWIKTGPDTFRLQYPWADGTEVLEVSRDLLSKWQIVCTLRPSANEKGLRPPARQRTLATGVATEDSAAGLAEAFILQERGSVAKMKTPDAPWRLGRASVKQLELLARWRVPHNPKAITKGEASDLLDLAASRRPVRR
jgi:ATP-dependent helicase IRC3